MNEILCRGDAEEAPAVDHDLIMVSIVQRITNSEWCLTAQRNAKELVWTTICDLTNNLIGVLCRFKRYPYAITCDVQKMLHQFVIRKEDRDFLRFLWWPNGDVSKDPKEYRMEVYLFGLVVPVTTSSTWQIKRRKCTLQQPSSFRMISTQMTDWPVRIWGASIMSNSRSSRNL